MGPCRCLNMSENHPELPVPLFRHRQRVRAGPSTREREQWGAEPHFLQSHGLGLAEGSEVQSTPSGLNDGAPGNMPMWGIGKKSLQP